MTSQMNRKSGLSHLETRCQKGDEIDLKDRKKMRSKTANTMWNIKPVASLGLDDGQYMNILDDGQYMNIYKGVLPAFINQFESAERISSVIKVTDQDFDQYEILHFSNAVKPLSLNQWKGDELALNQDTVEATVCHNKSKADERNFKLSTIELEINGTLSIKEEYINVELATNMEYMNGTSTADVGDMNGKLATNIVEMKGTLSPDIEYINGKLATNKEDMNRTCAADVGDINGKLAENIEDMNGTLAGDVGDRNGTSAADVGDRNGTSAADVGDRNGTSAADVGDMKGTSAADFRDINGKLSTNVDHMNGTSSADVGDMNGTSSADVMDIKCKLATNIENMNGTYSPNIEYINEKFATNVEDIKGTSKADVGEMNGTSAAEVKGMNGQLATNRDYMNGTLAADFLEMNGTSSVDIEYINGKSATNIEDMNGTSAADIGNMNGKLATNVEDMNGTWAADVGDMNGTSSVDIEYINGKSATNIEDMNGISAADVWDMNGKLATNEEEMKGTSSAEVGDMNGTSSLCIEYINDKLATNKEDKNETSAADFGDINAKLATNIEDMNGISAADVGDMNKKLATNIEDMNGTSAAEVGDMNGKLATNVEDMKGNADIEYINGKLSSKVELEERFKKHDGNCKLVGSDFFNQFSGIIRLSYHRHQSGKYNEEIEQQQILSTKCNSRVYFSSSSQHKQHGQLAGTAQASWSTRIIISILLIGVLFTHVHAEDGEINRKAVYWKVKMDAVRYGEDLLLGCIDVYRETNNNTCKWNRRLKRGESASEILTWDNLSCNYSKFRKVNTCDLLVFALTPEDTELYDYYCTINTTSSSVKSILDGNAVVIPSEKNIVILENRIEVDSRCSQDLILTLKINGEVKEEVECKTVGQLSEINISYNFSKSDLGKPMALTAKKFNTTFLVYNGTVPSNYKAHVRTEDNTYSAIVGAVGGGIAVLVVAAVIKCGWWCYKRKKKMKEQRSMDVPFKEHFLSEKKEEHGNNQRNV